MTNYQYCNNLGLNNEYLNDVYDCVVFDTVCKPVGRIVKYCMTNGSAYEMWKKTLKNRPGSAKYLIIAMQNTLHCISLLVAHLHLMSNRFML